MSFRERPRAPLTRRRIFEAALELVDQEGGRALTMRRLGETMGVEAMSLYHHVGGKQDVLDGLSEVMVTQLDLTADEGGWREVLRRFMWGIRRIALVHPAAFQLVGMRPLNTRQAFPPIEAALRAMHQGGFDDAATFYAYRSVVAYTRGYVLAEIGGFTLEPKCGKRRRLTAPQLNAARYPHIAELGRQAFALDHDTAFAYGVEAIIGGLERCRVIE